MKDLAAHNQKLLDKIVDSSIPTSPKFHNLSGKTFGRLKVDKYVGKNKSGNLFYQCTCKCGKVLIVQYSSLVNGVTTSCGCAHADIMREIKTTHGLRHHPLYRVWLNMIDRCRNPHNKHYNMYGGRGIKLCYDWQPSNPMGFQNFYNWSIENGWKPLTGKEKLTIDRIDFDGDYCPENCRWVSYKVQGNNTSRNRYYRVGPYVFTEHIWSEIIGLSSNTLRKRRNKGWSDVEVICTPSPSSDPNPCKVLYVPSKYDIYNQYQIFVNKGLIEPEKEY